MSRCGTSIARLFTGMTKPRPRELWSGPEKLARAEHEQNLAICLTWRFIAIDG